MTDEQQPASEETLQELVEGLAQENQEEEKKRIQQNVEIREIGPCKKHLKVTIDREAIDSRLNDKYKELVTGDTVIPGFRPGKAPRKLIERRFQEDVTNQVKGELLLASLEQLADEHDLAPLAPPDLDIMKITIPKEGPLIYEFEVEVRPEFDLPDYRGLKLKRPVKTFTDEDVAREQRRILAPEAQVIPKPEGNAQLGDIVIADVTIRDGEKVLNFLTEYAIRLDTKLAFKDGVADRFGEQMQGASAGQTRVVDIALSSGVSDTALRGKVVQASFDVKDIKTLRMPELTHEFLHKFGAHSEDQFQEMIRAMLLRRLEHVQRQSARDQVIEQIAATSTWQLPEDLLLRQARRAMARKLMEMRSEGIPEEDIRGRQRLLEQDILRSTALALKEHFVLQKIAEQEGIDVDEADIDAEIERIAEQNDESPRRVRARLEKDDLIEALAAEIVEGKALDLILESAVYEDVPLDQEAGQAPVGMVEEQTVPGEMHDPTAPPPPAEKKEGEPPTESAEASTQQGSPPEAPAGN